MTLWSSPRSAQTSELSVLQTLKASVASRLWLSRFKNTGGRAGTHGTHGTYGHISVQTDKLSFTEPCARKRSRHHAHD
jgi:hypothetical protein